MKSLVRIFSLIISLSLMASPIVAQTNSASLEIVTPTDGQVVYGTKIPILFKVTNFTLVNKEGAKPTSGEGKILLWLDDQNGNTDSSTKVYEESFTYSDVAYGDHTLKAELVTNDNKSLIPPQSTTIKFTSAVVPDAQEPATSSGFDKNTALVIFIVVGLVIVAAWWYTKDEEEEPVEKVSKPQTSTKKKSAKSGRTVKRKS
ncbi:MAG: hypothetical protein AAB512_00655 [Patescibacteria group bacterium]